MTKEIKVKLKTKPIVLIVFSFIFGSFGCMCIFFSLGIIVGDPDKILNTYSDRALWTFLGLLFMAVSVLTICGSLDSALKNDTIIIEPNEIKERDAEEYARKIFEEILETKFKTKSI